MNIQHLSTPADELLSALVDGELNAAESAQALASASSDASTARRWHTYHLIGDALRAQTAVSAQVAAGRDAEAVSAFTQRLSARLALENIAPAEVQLRRVPEVPEIRPDFGLKQAANDGNVRWKLLASVACMGTVAALAWGVSGLSGQDSARQLAQSAASQVVVASPQGPVVRDIRLEELLAAHKQMGGTSLPVPTGFLRSASFENQQAGRR